jgi:hypothetical protein
VEGILLGGGFGAFEAQAVGDTLDNDMQCVLCLREFQASWLLWMAFCGL